MEDRHFESVEIYKNLDNDDFVLSNVYDIDNVLQLIKDDVANETHLSNLKKYRNELISTEIDKYQNRIDKMKKLVGRTMLALSPGKKTLNFPGVGKVTRKENDVKWEIQNQEELEKYLESKGLKNEVMDSPDPKFSKSKFNSLLPRLDPEKVPGLKKEEVIAPISISWSKEGQQDSAQQTQSEPKVTSEVAEKPKTKQLSTSDV